jgi:hypothetical protein
MLADTTLPAAENSAANSSALVLKDRLPTKTFVCRDINGDRSKKKDYEKTKGVVCCGLVRIRKAELCC